MAQIGVVFVAKDMVVYTQFQLVVETINTVRIQRRNLLLRAIDRTFERLHTIAGPVVMKDSIKLG